MILQYTTIGDLADLPIGEVLGLLFCLCIAICIISLIIIKRHQSQNDEAPICEENATVIEKPDNAPGTVVIYTAILFQTESGQRIRLSVKGNNTYVVGDTGYLRWQGTRMLSFDVGIHRAKP